MLKFGKGVVKARFFILILASVLFIPSVFGYIHTRINYDVLTYLPKNLDTMKGQDILVDEFGTGAYSMLICEGMSEKDVSSLKKKVEDVDHVKSVIWYDSFADLSVPMKSVLPKKVYDAFNSDDSTMMFVIFDTGTSTDETMAAVKAIRALSSKQVYLSGMSAIVTDTKDLAEKEVTVYVALAVLLMTIVLMLFLDSFLVPFLFLISIGAAIIYNMGSNILMGEISYLTKAIAAVLQLGVTMDYSIFLWHSYQEMQQLFPDDHKEAMARAIAATLKSVLGSSITTIAGFVALCFMSFTLGLDIGLVMAKGVVIGVIACVTILPSLILVCDRLLLKTKHRNVIPSYPKVTDFVMKHYKVFVLILAIGILPAAYCQAHTSVYYRLDTSLPNYLPSVQANTKLKDEYGLGATHMALVSRALSQKTINSLTQEMENVDGVKSVLSLDSVIGPSIPMSMVPQQIRDTFESANWKMLIINNKYQTATNKVNAQCTKLEKIIHSYDPNGLLVGEAPGTKDLIQVTAHDFAVVDSVSIGLVFLIIFFVFRSWTLPFFLICTIEFAIFINMGIPFFTGTKIPFIASIVIGTIQLGSTVDYAILMTGRYETERCAGKTKKEAIWIAHRTSFRSIIVSAGSFFAATFGVGMYSGIDMISSLCILMARGALVSMVVVLFILPSMLMVFDKVIIRTSRNFRKAGIKN